MFANSRLSDSITRTIAEGQNNFGNKISFLTICRNNFRKKDTIYLTWSLCIRCICWITIVDCPFSKATPDFFFCNFQFLQQDRIIINVVQSWPRKKKWMVYNNSTNAFTVFAGWFLLNGHNNGVIFGHFFYRIIISTYFNHTYSWLYELATDYGRPMKPFFHQNSKLLGLGRQFG